MKKIKLFLCVALFGAMSFGAFSAYEYLTMSEAERALLENIEALTSNEGASNNWNKYDTHCDHCGESKVPSCMWDYEGFGSSCTPSSCKKCGGTMGGYTR